MALTKIVKQKKKKIQYWCFGYYVISTGRRLTTVYIIGINIRTLIVFQHTPTPTQHTRCSILFKIITRI